MEKQSEVERIERRKNVGQRGVNWTDTQQTEWQKLHVGTRVDS